MADTSLWPVIVGGLLGVGGTLVGVIGTTIRDVAQQRHEKAKRRADKFEELVAAVYEFDHWLDGLRHRDAFGQDIVPMTLSPFAKLQSISAVYFPQFDKPIVAMSRAANRFMYKAEQKNITQNAEEGFDEVIQFYVNKREALLDALKAFAHG